MPLCLWLISLWMVRRQGDRSGGRETGLGELPGSASCQRGSQSLEASWLWDQRTLKKLWWTWSPVSVPETRRTLTLWGFFGILWGNFCPHSIVSTYSYSRKTKNWMVMVMMMMWHNWRGCYEIFGFLKEFCSYGLLLLCYIWSFLIT